MHVDSLLRRFEFKQPDQSRRTFFNAASLMYPDTNGNTLDSLAMSFSSCRWLCEEQYMDDHVKAEFRTSTSVPVQPPLEVRPLALFEQEVAVSPDGGLGRLRFK
jgi:hypothetical protein